jgi:uncharacterized protein YjbJ (UPF0337 family)
MVNQQVLEGHWNELTGRLKEKWGQLTDDDLDRVKGNVSQLVGLIQQKTGWAKGRVEEELDELMTEGSAITRRAADAARNVASNVGERAQQGYQEVSERFREGYTQAEEMLQRRPVESVAAAFGSGLIVGIVVGLMMRGR